MPPETITLDLPCIKCGYNLRTRPVNASCPECGESIATSQSVALAAWPLNDLEHFINAVRLVAWANFLPVVLVALFFAYVLAFEPFSDPDFLPQGPIFILFSSGVAVAPFLHFLAIRELKSSHRQRPLESDDRYLWFCNLAFLYGSFIPFLASLVLFFNPTDERPQLLLSILYYCGLILLAFGPAYLFLLARRFAYFCRRSNHRRTASCISLTLNGLTLSLTLIFLSQGVFAAFDNGLGYTLASFADVVHLCIKITLAVASCLLLLSLGLSSGAMFLFSRQMSRIFETARARHMHEALANSNTYL